MSKKLLFNAGPGGGGSSDGDLIQDNLIGWFDGRDPGENVAQWINKGSLGPDLNLLKKGPVNNSGFMNNGHKFTDGAYFITREIPQSILNYKNFTLFIAFQFTENQTNTYEAVVGLTQSARNYASINAEKKEVPAIVLPNTLSNEGTLYLNLPSFKTVLCYGANEKEFFCYDENGIELNRSNLKKFTAPTEVYLTLGQLRKDTTVRKFNGYIYDVALYNKGLTEEEIKQNLAFFKNRLNS